MSSQYPICRSGREDRISPRGTQICYPCHCHSPEVPAYESRRSLCVLRTAPTQALGFLHEACEGALRGGGRRHLLGDCILRGRVRGGGGARRDAAVGLHPLLRQNLRRQLQDGRQATLSSQRRRGGDIGHYTVIAGFDYEGCPALPGLPRCGA